LFISDECNANGPKFSRITGSAHGFSTEQGCGVILAGKG
jgi:hypothetical protein